MEADEVAEPHWYLLWHVKGKPDADIWRFNVTKDGIEPEEIIYHAEQIFMGYAADWGMICTEVHANDHSD